jgi:hypothetical protein
VGCVTPMKLNFKQMNKADLRACILECREDDKNLIMKFSLFSKVQLTKDIPQFNLKKGSIGTIVEYYLTSENMENGYSIEGLINQDTVEVTESQIELISIHQNPEKVSSK